MCNKQQAALCTAVAPEMTTDMSTTGQAATCGTHVCKHSLAKTSCQLAAVYGIMMGEAPPSMTSRTGGECLTNHAGRLPALAALTVKCYPKLQKQPICGSATPPAMPPAC